LDFIYFTIFSRIAKGVAFEITVSKLAGIELDSDARIGRTLDSKMLRDKANEYANDPYFQAHVKKDLLLALQNLPAFKLQLGEV
jgi:hypothetical protein